MDGISFQIGGSVLGGGVVAILLAVATRIRSGSMSSVVKKEIYDSERCGKIHEKNEEDHGFFFASIHNLREREAARTERDVATREQLDRIETKLDKIAK